MGVKKVSPSATTALIVVAFFLTTLTKASAGTEKVLANFPGGLQPWAGLVSDAAGNFYGVTYYGGPNGKGEVFRVRYSAATGWSECTAYGFKGGKEGAAPYGGLIFDAASNLYGTTSSGGFYGEGTAFKLAKGFALDIPLNSNRCSNLTLQREQNSRCNVHNRVTCIID